MPLNCPKHPGHEELEKVRLDCYYCPECDHDWLIHPYKSDRKGVKKPRK